MFKKKKYARIFFITEPKFKKKKEVICSIPRDFKILVVGARWILWPREKHIRAEDSLSPNYVHESDCDMDGVWHRG